MSKNPNPKPNPAVEKIKREAPDGTVTVIGYRHSDDDTPDGYVYIYPSLDDLAVGYLVREKDIVLPDAAVGDGPHTFYVKAEAKIILTTSLSAQEQKRIFLVGAITSSYPFLPEPCGHGDAVTSNKVNGACVLLRSGGTASCN